MNNQSSNKSRPKGKAALPSSQDRYLTDREVAKRFGVCRQTVWRWVKQSQFPEPLKFSVKVTRWRLSDLIAHEASLSSKSKSIRKTLSPLKAYERDA
ncbi:helix-turn-helix transcriptional regulator [Shimia thalassica]|uniref:helix-turn-helix transcriptional regulator n=1 Tax=Shimia thalassica TaxID=1715693 RepID=UPI003D6636C5